MKLAVKSQDLPLHYRTPDTWAALPLSNLPALLSDHAYLERKAASNALELLNRWPVFAPQATWGATPGKPAAPDFTPPETWTTTISAVARDEANHLNAVIKIMRRRGWDLERLHRGKYPGDLRTLVRLGKGPHEVLDRLLVSALIEARSCERFGILARVCADRELAEFYGGLYISELGHFKVFKQLGEAVLSVDEVDRRWEQMLEAEARIIQDQPAGVGLHSGIN
jgi:tRNA 2-(methylsulfanyl)-N6-isopentenyladenosine37 hydroxylase